MQCFLRTRPSVTVGVTLTLLKGGGNAASLHFIPVLFLYLIVLNDTGTAKSTEKSPTHPHRLRINGKSCWAPGPNAQIEF